MSRGRQRPNPMRVRLTDERRARLRDSVRRHYAEEHDQEISDFRLEGLIDFFVRELGPPVYNQAIRDAHEFFETRLADLEAEFYEPEEPTER